ncbi:MAG: hypothetical protein M3068_12045 [Gemmatimonadota bacterium]|nr:hypothetical protein [Gemmatimonadota bacterium]
MSATAIAARDAAAQPAPSPAPERSRGLEHAAAAWEQALVARPELVRESAFLFGGRRVRMRVVGPALAHALTRPFSHLRTTSRSAQPLALSIDVWDERESGVPYPSSGDISDPESVWPSPPGALAASVTSRFIRYDCPAWVTWLDRAARRIIGWRSCADRLSMNERTRPLPFLLPVWYADQGIETVHAGLVAGDGRGILFCGSGGAGKSTCSLACLSSGLDFLSDDHVGLEEREDGTIVGHSMFASTRVEPDHLLRFSRLAPHAIRSRDPVDTKSLLFPAEIFAERVKPSVPIRVIALPRITSEPSSAVRRATRSEALRAIAPSSLIQMPFGNTKRRFAALAHLAERVPAYWLELGPDLDEIPRRAESLLRALE